MYKFNKEQAFKILEQHTRKESLNPKQLCILGYCLLNGEYIEKNIEKGIKLLNDSSQAKDYIAMYQLGQYYLNIKNHDQARKYFSQMIKSKPNEFYKHHANKGICACDSETPLSRIISWFRHLKTDKPRVKFNDITEIDSQELLPLEKSKSQTDECSPNNRSDKPVI